MKIKGTTKICGVMGHPIEHTMSPLMHNLFTQETGVDMVYVPFLVQPETVKTAVEGAFALNIQGINVTVPHKQAVMECLVEIDEDAQAIGAVNTLVRQEHKHGYKGYNTDAAGLLRAMQEEQIEIKGQNCILLGAGGAAKAVAYMLVKAGAAHVYVLNRSIEKAMILMKDMNQLFGREVLSAVLLDHWREIPQEPCLAIQTTSVGMHPWEDKAPVEEAEFYQNIHTAVDIIYTPLRTKFMKMAASAGAKTMNGLMMLLYQGITAYELWNPEVTVPPAAIEEARQLIQSHLGGDMTKENIVLIGFMGAGKTRIGSCYSYEQDWPLLDTDALIEKKAGMEIRQIFASQGEPAFRTMETEVLKNLLVQTDRAVISVGGGLPLQTENQEILRRLGTVVFLRVTRDTVLERLAGDNTRPLLQGKEKEKKIDELLAYRNPIYEQVAHLIIDVDGKTKQQIVDEIHGKLASK